MDLCFSAQGLVLFYCVFFLSPPECSNICSYIINSWKTNRLLKEAAVGFFFFLLAKQLN